MSNNKQDYDSDSFTWEELVEWAKGTKIFTVSDERIVAGKFEFLQNGDVYLGISVLLLVLFLRGFNIAFRMNWKVKSLKDIFEYWRL